MNAKFHMADITTNWNLGELNKLSLVGLVQLRMDPRATAFGSSAIRLKSRNLPPVL